MEGVNFEELYKSFLSNVSYPVWIAGFDLKILFLNKSYEEKYNIKLEDVIGKSIVDIFPVEKSKIFNEKLYKHLEESVEYVVEELVQGVFVRCNIFTVSYNMDKFKAMACVVIDNNNIKLRETDMEKQKNILRTIIDL